MNNLQFVANGKTEYSVKILQSGEVETYAAEELIRFVLKCSSAELILLENPCKKTVFIGGDYPRNSDKPDGFAIIFNGENISIKGNSPRGTLYGVYDFLEKYLGIRFLTSSYTYIPKISEVIIPAVSYNSEPDFNIRTYLYAGLKNNGEFSARARMYNENYDLPSKCGGPLSWNLDFGTNHTTLQFVSPKYYFTEENKEQNKHMYQLDNKGVPVDLCFTDGLTDNGEWDKSINVSAFSVVLESFKKILKKDTKSKYFPFGQMDVTDCCQCSRCCEAEKKYKRSGMNIRFVNALSRELKKWMAENGEEREFYIVIFAYNYSTNPPIKIINKNPTAIDDTVIADYNICVRIASISTNCYYPFSSYMHFVPYKKIIEEWNIVCKNLMLWTYHTNYKCFLWYFPTLQHWEDDLNFLKNINVEYVFMQSNHLEIVDWKAEMELYIASKMLWNCSKNPNIFKNEFINLFYGIAAPYVNQIIEVFDKNYQKIADESVKMKKELFFEINNESLEVVYNSDLSSEELEEKLKKLKEDEWTKNVYFSIYHKEIMWKEKQPFELLEKQFDLLNEAKELINNSEYTDLDKERIICGLEKIELTIRFMLLYNYDNYYPNQLKKKKIFEDDFLSLCNKLGFIKIGEGQRTIDEVVKGGYILC